MTTSLTEPRPADTDTDADAAPLPGIVSVDDHVVEPPDLWTSRLASKHRERGPKVVRELVPSTIEVGTERWADVWHYEDTIVAIRRGFASVGMPAEDYDLEPMTLEEMRPGCYELDARLADMDADGVVAAVCFPNSFVRFCGQRFLEASDKDLALECVRAYNDWLLDDWCGRSGGRLAGSTIVPLWDVDLAVAELRRNADRGVRAVCFSEIPARLGLPSMYSGYWEPMFEVCAGEDIVINLHIGSSSEVHTTSADAPVGVRVSNHFGNCSFSLTDWLASGALLRHPRLKIAFSEGQAGWVPYLMSRLDGLWRAGSALAGFADALPEPPSSYLRDHVYFCIFDDPTILRHLDLVPEDNLCFETDYPHPDGSWPHSRATARQQTAGLTSQQRDKLLWRNAARLYRFDRILEQTG